MAGLHMGRSDTVNLQAVPVRCFASDRGLGGNLESLRCVFGVIAAMQSLRFILPVREGE